MSIWFRDYTIDEQEKMRSGNILEHLDIHITAIGDDYISGTMPVDHRTIQPHGILHGGASVVLAETLGSVAANMVLDNSKFIAVGLDVNANHLRPVTKGLVTAKASALHLGRSTQVWHIEIVNEAGKKVCVSRLTMAVVPAQKR